MHGTSFTTVEPRKSGEARLSSWHSKLYFRADAAICKPTQHASIVPADRVDESKELQPLCMLGWASLSESRLLEQNFCHES